MASPLGLIGSRNREKWRNPNDLPGATRL